ncbi:MAG TPA: sensor domain-containing protein, partial [Ilumatobacteraceae bacterium]|nr:sensor domain-containing protein [Ilumatobacteraceae bacterium]
MTGSPTSHRTGFVATLSAPWRQPDRLWRALGATALALPLGTISFSVMVTLLSTAAGLAITVVFAVPVLWLGFVVSRGFARLERSRVAVLLDTPLADPVPPLAATSWLRRVWERVQSPDRWREIAHHLLALPIGVVSFTLVLAVWAGSLALALLPLYVSALPGESAKFWIADVSQGLGSLAVGVVGVLGVGVVAPHLTMAMGRLQSAAARWLLSPRRAVLEAQLEQLETSRSAAVDSAEAERRRIERDLHDGAQQRLVALAATLGDARQRFDSDPEVARAMVDDAHQDAKAALKEIRDLVRGINPFILQDRGLDAALSAVVARSPVPVDLEVRLADRPPAAVESAAYFVVAEALTNVARHADATRAHVAVARSGNRVVVEVRDDGR